MNEEVQLSIWSYHKQEDTVIDEWRSSTLYMGLPQTDFAEVRYACVREIKAVKPSNWRSAITSYGKCVKNVDS